MPPTIPPGRCGREPGQDSHADRSPRHADQSLAQSRTKSRLYPRDRSRPHIPLFGLEHWNSSAWRIVPAPGGGDEYLTSVAAASRTDVWAVGNQFSTSLSQFEPLFEHWNLGRPTGEVK